MDLNSRRMIYPYTLTAKLAQFPYAFYWKWAWSFKYFFVGMIATAPLIYKIQTLLYSPANVAAYEAYLKKEEELHREHMAHLK